MSEVGGVVVLDFGSQYTQLIARRLREFGVYSEILPYDEEIESIRSLKPRAIVLSGGPSSVAEKDSPVRNLTELREISPLLGICYGMQLMAQQWKGKVTPQGHREYGRQAQTWTHKIPGVPENQSVWMSHGDVVEKVPDGFEVMAKSEDGAITAMKGPGVLGLQFHPEVTHSEFGDEVLKYFLNELTDVDYSWSAKHIVEHLKDGIREQVSDEKSVVLCGLSGGVDSTITATILTQVLGADRVKCVFVNNGLLRKDEFTTVLEMYKELGLSVKGVEAEDIFLDALKGVVDPEEKRKIIGHKFIEVFEKASEDISNVEYLAQGTLYPDVIESVSLRGTSVTIKSHHNVGGLPETMKLKLVEPLRELFKDEVRKVGEEIGVPKEAVWRHPFPGPGLAVRVLGEITREKLEILKEVDAVFINALKDEGLYDKIWQAFAVLLPVKTVGVQGDGRSYAHCVALRAVNSRDGMTADWFEFPDGFLRRVSNKITNKVSGVNRVVYDITSKPPGTIEWE